LKNLRNSQQQQKQQQQQHSSKKASSAKLMLIVVRYTAEQQWENERRSALCFHSSLPSFDFTLITLPHFKGYSLLFFKIISFPARNTFANFQT
jgi:hypothetical protein